jgi:large subunit ribosomal protein L11
MAKIIGVIKFRAPAGKATPAAPIGPALGQKGLSIMDFCKKFNAQTAHLQPGRIVLVVVTVLENKQFTFTFSEESEVSLCLKEALGITKGSAQPNKQKVGTLSFQQIEGIAKKKMLDLNTRTLKCAVLMVLGTAKSMGIMVEEGNNGCL